MHEKFLQEQIAQWVVNPNQGIVDDLIQMVIGCNLTFQHWYPNQKIDQDWTLKASSITLGSQPIAHSMLINTFVFVIKHLFKIWKSLI